MNSAPLWMIVALLWTFLVGLVVLYWGTRLPRQGDWLVGGSLVGLFVTLVINRDESAWLRGWIWPRLEPGALVVGGALDPLSLVFAGLSIALAGLVLVNRALLLREERPERVYAAAAIACPGVALAWSANTPWLAFCGMVLAVFGGFISLGATWNSEVEAAVASRFVRERAWGLLVMILGACAMSSSGHILNWDSQAATATSGDFLGALFLATGLYLMLQPFPLLGAFGMPSESLPLNRIVFAQVLPAWSTFSVFARFEPVFRESHIFPAFGWIGLVSAVLAVICGLLQPGWRQALGTWLSSAFSLCLAGLCFAGPWAGIAMLLGVSLAAVSIATLASAMDGGNPREKNPDAFWPKVVVFVGAACGSGMLGFVGAGGIIRWLTTGVVDNLAYVYSFSLFLNAVLLWRVAWTIYRQKGVLTPSWSATVTPAVLLIGGLGIFWTGSVTGGVVAGDSDQVLNSILSGVFPAGIIKADNEAFAISGRFHWGALAFAIFAAYWTAGREPDLWAQLRKRFPTGSRFISGGFGADRAGQEGLAVVLWSGRSLQRLVDHKIWQDWLPSGTHWCATRLSRFVSRADSALTFALNRAAQRSTDVPGKFLQLIQSGDIQWYLVFAIGSGIAILLHFLRLA